VERCATASCEPLLLAPRRQRCDPLGIAALALAPGARRSAPFVLGVRIVQPLGVGRQVLRYAVSRDAGTLWRRALAIDPLPDRAVVLALAANHEIGRNQRVRTMGCIPHPVDQTSCLDVVQRGANDARVAASARRGSDDQLARNVDPRVRNGVPRLWEREQPVARPSELFTHGAAPPSPFLFAAHATQPKDPPDRDPASAPIPEFPTWDNPGARS